MLYKSFCKELIKVANPQVLRHLNAYDPDAAKAALQDEFGILMKALNKDGLPMEAQVAIRRRIDDLNRVDYLIDSYKKSYSKKGDLESPKSHMMKGLQEKIDDLTREQRAALSRQVLEGKTTKQNVEIAMKHRVREHVPIGVTKEYVENIEGILGLSDDPKYGIYKKDNEIVAEHTEDLRMDSPAGSMENTEQSAEEPIEEQDQEETKEANIKPSMMPVTGSKGRNASGIAMPKKGGSASEPSKTIIPQKLMKSLMSKEKKSVGSLSNVGSSPRSLGLMKKAKVKSSLKSAFLSPSYSKKKVSKSQGPSLNTLKVALPFNRKSFKSKTPMSKYLNMRGFKSTL